MAEARRAYHNGIQKAWDIYTENNELVKRAKKTLDVTIHEAYELQCKNEDEMSDEEYARANRICFKAARKAYEDFSEVVNHIWEDFVKDMESLQSTEMRVQG